jgi:hypothetical protein
MESIEVAKDTRLGSLVPLDRWTSDIKMANPSSICVFMFGGCDGLGFYVPWSTCVWFSLSLGSILIIYVAI